MIEMVTFLGNPGAEYARTRHNMGRMLIESLPEAPSLMWREKFHGKTADYGTGPGKCRFLRPETFMNVSGKSVSAAVNFHKVDISNLLVVHDDLELPFGQFAWRLGGGLAGHNGLKSIRDSLGNTGFRRLRLGIGRPPRGSVHSWVLGRFSPEEEAVLPGILDAAAKELDDVLGGSTAILDRSEALTVYSAD